MRIEDMEREAGFVLEAGDCFHSITVSEEIRFESDPDATAVLAFFVIRRASGRCDIVFIHRTFRCGECVSRVVQRKTGIRAVNVDGEVRLIREAFTVAARAGTGLPIEWNSLDLSAVRVPAEQVRLIREWGRVAVSLLPGSG